MIGMRWNDRPRIPMWYTKRGWVFSLRRSKGTRLAFASFECSIPLHVQSHACDFSHALALHSCRSTQAACEVDLLKGTTSKTKHTQGQQALHFLYACIEIEYLPTNWCLKKKTIKNMTRTRWGAKGSEKRPTVTAEELQKHTSEEAATKL